MNTALSLSNELDMSSYFMGFTGNRAFRQKPLLLERAQGLYYYTADGRKILDGMAGMWCCNAGHCHPRIVEAIQSQIATLDYSPAFQVGHSKAFELARRVAEIAPAGLNRVFFTNSGSEAVDSALKIALAYHQVRGQGQRTRLIGRERGYHGAGFGGISVGGIGGNRKNFGPLLPGVLHIPHTHDREHQAFSRGQPAWGAHLADGLERALIANDPSTVAAVIVEPFAGSTGVLPPPVGYLERLRQICDRHGILLIFDEVITAFGRVGSAFGAQRFGVTPDMITLAKGITSGMIPMGGVVMRQDIHDALMVGPEHAVELAHGYTYSGHPVAAAAGLATLDVYRDEGLFERARAREAYFEEAVHSLRGLPHVVDIRNIGLAAAVELEPRAGAPGLRAFEAFRQMFDLDVLGRCTGDTLAFSPPLTIGEGEIDVLFGTVRKVLTTLA
jgi:beta-alanine--pyruvate transaminase